MIWNFIVWMLSLAVADVETARCYAAVSAAYASLAVRDEVKPEPQPEPAPGKCCSECGGTGWVTRDGVIRTPCDCPPSCKCKAGEKFK